MGHITGSWSPKKTHCVLRVILVVLFGFLFARSILVITDHQSLLDDLGKADSLSSLEFDDEQLLVNPDDWQVIRSQIAKHVKEGADMSLSSPNTGLFYDMENRELQIRLIRDLVIMEDDDEEIIDGISYVRHRTPEALFDDHMLLVSGGVNVLGDALQMIRDYAKGGVTTETYDGFLFTLSRPDFLHVLVHRHDIETRNAARILLERFHPNKTL
jgi:hypothetical protein